MSFVGSIGCLMMNTGLDVILKLAFGGVEKLLSGKKFPQNVRALRLVAEELLNPYLPGIHSYDDLTAFLDDISQKSLTSKLWSDCLIKPVLYMMLYIRAEIEGDWLLHLHAVSVMMPYFFAAWTSYNYARYGTYYLQNMRKLPHSILDKFLHGEHTTRHHSGVWNGIWSDMFIETSFMRYGKGPGGLIGLTLNEQSVKKWAYGLHICTEIIRDLAKMRSNDD